MIQSIKALIIIASFASVSVLGFSGCATILSGTSDNIIIQSTPASANYVITTLKYDTEVASGSTPATVNLSRKSEYKVTIKLAGYKDKVIPIYQEFNGWTICNICIGGILGVGIDFFTGALFKLAPQQIRVSLETASIDGNHRLYGVIRRLDENGQLRELRVPLEKDNLVTSH